MNKIVQGLTLLTLSITSQIVVAEGIRARGMGEAFHSLSNDGTGWLYNPAGLAGVSTNAIDFTIEGAETWKRNDETGDIEKDSLGFSYVSASYFTKSGLAVGIYYQTSSIQTRENLGDPDSWYNRIKNIDRNILGLGLAFKSDNHHFGVTGDMAQVDTGSTYAITDDYKFGGTFGYKWSTQDMVSFTAHSALGYQLNLGASYQTEMAYKSDIYGSSKEIIIRPSKTALAASLALTTFFGDIGTMLTGSYDYVDSSHLLLSTSNDVVENRFGGELAIFGANTEDGLQLTLRAGLRQFDDDLFNDVTSLGLGLSYGRHTVDVASWEEPLFNVTDDRIGVSYSYLWAH
ncbi:hypothetical protein AB4341_05755 [Vibrio breoganii]